MAWVLANGVVGGVALLAMAALTARFSPWAGVALFVVASALLLTVLAYRLTGDAWAVSVIFAGFTLRILAALGLFLGAALDVPALESIRTAEGHWTFALDAAMYEAQLELMLNGNSSQDAWVNDVTGEVVPAALFDASRASQDGSLETRGAGGRWRWVSYLQWTEPGLWVGLPSLVVAKLFGYTPLTALSLNAICAALASLVAYDVVRRWSGRGQARVATAWFAFWPSWILWSSVLLKESLVLLLLVLSVRCVVALDDLDKLAGGQRRRAQVAIGIAFVAIIGYLYFVRLPVAISWLVALELAAALGAVGALYCGRLREAGFRAALASLAPLGLFVITLSASYFQTHCVPCRLVQGDSAAAFVRLLAERRDNGLSVGGGLLPGATQALATTEDLVRLLPVATGNTWLAPYPGTWLVAGQSVGALRVASSLEMLLTYLLLLPLLLGTWHTLRRGPPGVYPVVVLGGVLTVGLGLLVVNEGTLFRLRSAPMAALVLLGVAGWSASASSLTWRWWGGLVARAASGAFGRSERARRA
jgi:hypothetical protein